MILVRALATPFVIAAVLLCCCGPAAELVPVFLERDPVHIVGPYSIGIPRGGGLELLGAPYEPADGIGIAYPTVVEQEIVRIGWNEEFILVEQHPLEEFIWATPDASNPTWHIVVVSTGEVYSDLSYEQFLFHRDTLGIPDTIVMRDAREVYAE